MGAGFDGNSLAVFTALAPAGAVAFLCLALVMAVRYREFSPEELATLRHAVFAPVAVVWAGFIASATHLGTPANALYVAAGIGRSPLSNEVAATAAFLLFSGLYWLYSFDKRRVEGVSHALFALSAVSAAALLAFTSLAYAVESVPSWDVWLTPANLLTTALFSGSALAAAVLLASGVESKLWPRALLVVSLAALVLGTVLLGFHVHFLQGVSNNVTTAAALAPSYPISIAAHDVLGLAGLWLQWQGLSLKFSRKRAWALTAAGWLLVAVAALLVRFPFYDIYLSAGF